MVSTPFPSLYHVHWLALMLPHQVAVGRRPHLNVFGNDYDTIDGTGVRDYIHVVDLARGHLAALQWLQRQEAGVGVFNLGTGTGYSLLQIAKALERASE